MRHMLHDALHFIGRIGRNVMTAAATVLCLVWFADALWGIGPADWLMDRAGDRVWALSERAGQVLEEVAGETWDEQTILRWRTQRTISLLAREIAQLQWVEAESMTQARDVEAQLNDLTANLEATREGLVELAKLMRLNPGAIYVDNLRYEGEQIDAYATQKMAEFNALEEQVELYRQAYATHRNAALDARALWMEAEQNIKTLQAHNTLLEATIALDSAREPTGEASQNVHQLSEQLRSQLERNRRIVERRRLLEDGVSSGETDLLELGTLLARSADLADALEKLATESTPR
ncbi:MAG: hypothetical protein KDD78_19560 [Caldilineaceae bacterium]|nr:hypothetical protein [Caldilineaceae bacterium]